MKKFILSAVAILLVGGACCVNAQEKSKEELKAEKALLKAQQKELSGFLKEAKKKSQTGEGYTPDFAAARAAIEAASKSPLASNSLEFYMQAAEVESNAFNVAAQTNDLPNYANSAVAGFNYYKRAYELAAGDKGKMTKIQAGALSLYQSTSGIQMAGNVYYSEGSNAADEATQKANFRKCLDTWNIAKTAHLEPMIKDNPLAAPIVEMYAADSLLKNLYLNGFYVAQTYLNDTVFANKELTYLKDNPENDSQLNQVLQQLALNYYGSNDSIRFEATLKEGAKRLPNEPWYVNNLLNTYLASHRYEEASTFVDRAIEADPGSAILYFIKGNLFEQLDNIEEAFKWYTKSYELDPSNVKVNYSIGHYYSTLAENIQDEYFNKKQFEKGNDEADKLFEKALPYYEAAYELDTERDEKLVGVALSVLYGRKLAKKNNAALRAKRDEVKAAYGLDY